MLRGANLVVIGISVGLALGILIASLIYYGLKWYKKQAYLRQFRKDRSVATLPIRTNGLDTSTNFSESLSHSVAIQEKEHVRKVSWWNHQSKDRAISVSGILRFSYKDIQRATQNFTDILGQGSFGPVYKAALPAGGVVAVKVLASDSKQGEKEFQTEVSLLGRLHHRNLVNLVGFCVEKGQHMLIYEFMSNGSLSYHLYSEERVLSWEERLQIALDISHGIEYLHEGAVPPVVHRDLKSANILLDQSMRAKVADFGLSKEAVFDGQNSGLKGTHGYIDPVYISTNKFTMKSDIYSFGIIVFELIIAIHPQQNLMEYIKLAAMSTDGIDDVLDKNLVGECNIDDIRSLASIGHKCLHKFSKKRPTSTEVSQAIMKIQQRQSANLGAMSFSDSDLSLAVSRIENQQEELSKMASIKE